MGSYAMYIALWYPQQIFWIILIVPLDFWNLLNMCCFCSLYIAIFILNHLHGVSFFFEICMLENVWALYCFGLFWIYCVFGVIQAEKKRVNEKQKFEEEALQSKLKVQELTSQNETLKKKVWVHYLKKKAFLFKWIFKTVISVLMHKDF